MTFRGLFTLAVVGGGLVLASNTAQAGDSYTATPSPASVTFNSPTPPNSIVSLGAVSSANPLSGPSAINVANVTLTSTTLPPATDTTSFTVTIPIVITNTAPNLPGTGTITLTGTLAFQRSDMGGELSTFTNPTFTNNGAVIGGVTYTLSFQGYAAPTVNSVPGDGNISVVVSPSGVVPEPASMVMLGSGLVGILGFRGWRRMKKVA
jgi:hypothetical protein